MYLVLVDVMDRSYVTNNCFFLSEFELHLYTSLWPISKDNFFKKNLNSQTRLINGFYLTYKIESKGTCGLFEGQPASEHLSSHLSQNISIELIDSVFVAYCSAGTLSKVCGPFLVKFWDSVIFPLSLLWCTKVIWCAAINLILLFSQQKKRSRKN